MADVVCSQAAVASWTGKGARDTVLPAPDRAVAARDCFAPCYGLRYQMTITAPSTVADASEVIFRRLRKIRDSVAEGALRDSDIYRAEPRTPAQEALPPTLIVDRVVRRHEEINRMVDVGYPLSEIACRLGLDRKTVRRYRDTSFDVLLASARDRRNVPLDRQKP